VSRKIKIDSELVTSEAWLKLGKTAMIVYLIFLTKKTHHLNGERVTFTYLEAKRDYGISPGRFVRAIDELIQAGFIAIISSSGGMKKERTYYRLSDGWHEPDFKPVERLKRSPTDPCYKPKNWIGVTNTDDSFDN
jgi:hypothetical protein